MKSKEIFKKLKNTSEQELSKELKENRDRLWSLKNDLSSGKIKNASEINSTKKTIARIMTLLNKAK